MNPRRRLIFKEPSKMALGDISVEKDWLLWARRPGDPANQVPFELEYRSEEEDVTVIYVDDPIAECSYAHVSGRDMANACEVIRGKIPVWTDKELLNDWDEAPHDSAQIAAILRIGVGAPSEYDEGFAERLRAALARSDPAVREAALAAIGYTEWPEFDEALVEILESDPDERCRKRAAHMLEVRESERDVRRS